MKFFYCWLICSTILLSACSQESKLLPAETHTRLADFQKLQRGDLLVETDKTGNLRPVMLVVAISGKSVEIEFAANKSTRVKFNLQSLSQGQLHIVAKNNPAWGELIHQFYN